MLLWLQKVFINFIAYWFKSVQVTWIFIRYYNLKSILKDWKRWYKRIPVFWESLELINIFLKTLIGKLSYQGFSYTFGYKLDANLHSTYKFTLKHRYNSRCFFAFFYKESNKLKASSSCSCFFSGINSRS